MILGHLNDASAFIECAARVLDAWDSDERFSPGPETACFRHGIDLFDEAYTELDEAIMALNRERRQLQ